MKLGELLLNMPEEHIDRLATEHVRTTPRPAREALYGLLEGIIRNFKFVNDYILNRQPPTFAILKLLLDSPDLSTPTSSFRDSVTQETRRICELLDRSEILEREEQLRLYRRVLRAARKVDLEMNASEVAILAAVRDELSISNAEHYVIEHHAELREFWERDNAFLHELHALTSAGIVFAHGGVALLPLDLAPFVRRAIGLEMPSENARRVFSLVTNSDLFEALSRHGVKASGSKEERIARLLDNFIQPSVVLRRLSQHALRDICRGAGANISGSKDDLVERIIEHFAAGLDQVAKVEEPELVVVREPRVLEERRFRALFRSLKGHALGHILEAFPELRQSGTKETRAGTLWDSPRSEATLLNQLKNHELEDVLWKFELRGGGSKAERIDRLVAHFKNAPEELLASAEAERDEPEQPSAIPGAQATGAEVAQDPMNGALTK